MDSNEKFLFWFDLAQYDLDTAESMLISKRWLYVVFMCQQAVEKLVKGIYVLYLGDNVPRTHNIRVIFEKYEDQLSEKIDERYIDLFEDLTIHYINGRYVDYKQKLSDRLDENASTEILRQTREVFAWLMTMKR